MGRPRIIEDEQILDAAREVFVAKGAGASTEDVARRAGVSQASIFKRFKTKQELFLTAMHFDRERQTWIEQTRRRAGEVGIREALIETGVRAIGFMRLVLPLILVGWSIREALGVKAGLGRVGAQAKELIGLLEEEMRAGRIRKQDPTLTMRAFIGAMQSYVLMGLVDKKLPGQELKPEEYVRGIVDVLWQGIGPPPRRTP